MCMDTGLAMGMAVGVDMHVGMHVHVHSDMGMAPMPMSIPMTMTVCARMCARACARARACDLIDVPDQTRPVGSSRIMKTQFLRDTKVNFLRERPITRNFERCRHGASTARAARCAAAARGTGAVLPIELWPI